MENLIQKIRGLNWEELNFENGVTIEGTGQSLLLVDDERATLNFLDRKVSEEGEISFENSYSHLQRIEFPNDFPLEDVITTRLKLRHYARFNEVFSFNSESVECLSIT